MQQRLIPIKLNRVREDYSQINSIDDNGIQTIEVNRGCKRGCTFCYADPNYKVFDVPEIRSNKVKIRGEGFLYDPKIKEKIIKLGEKRFNNKVVYYELNQGIDFRLLTKEIAELLSKYRFGLINKKGNWYKSIKFAWDLGKHHETLVKETIDLFESVGYRKKTIMLFVLINWKISYEDCLYKLDKLWNWGVQIDPCTWDTTKKEKLPLHWTKDQLKKFLRKARKHNQLIRHDGYDPEAKD